MKYHYQLRDAGILDGTVMTVTAATRHEANVTAINHLLTIQTGMPKARIEFLASGNVSAAALMGAKGGAKSKRKITKTQQAAMQKARKAKALS